MQRLPSDSQRHLERGAVAAQHLERPRAYKAKEQYLVSRHNIFISLYVLILIPIYAPDWSQRGIQEGNETNNSKAFLEFFLGDNITFVIFGVRTFNIIIIVIQSRGCFGISVSTLSRQLLAGFRAVGVDINNGFRNRKERSRPVRTVAVVVIVIVLAIVPGRTTVIDSRVRDRTRAGPNTKQW
jgi:hypothetical protein